MTMLRPIRSLADAEVRLGDVLRWGTDGRWALVVETEPDGPQGELARLRWVFGRDRGDYVSDGTPEMIEGWVLLRTNRHGLYRRYGTHTAKHRKDAEKDGVALLGHKADGWYETPSNLRNPMSRNPTEH